MADSSNVDDSILDELLQGPETEVVDGSTVVQPTVTNELSEEGDFVPYTDPEGRRIVTDLGDYATRID